MTLVTNKDISMNYMGEDILIPKGTKLTNKTALGHDPKYNFVDEFDWYKPELKGFARTMALHDMVHIGINIDSKDVSTM